MLSVPFSFCYAECHYAECHYAGCRGINKTSVLKCALTSFVSHLKMRLSQKDKKLKISKNVIITLADFECNGTAWIRHLCKKIAL
jgi:hypothetical protein